MTDWRKRAEVLAATIQRMDERAEALRAEVARFRAMTVAEFTAYAEARDRDIRAEAESRARSDATGFLSYYKGD